ncbi:MAG TPA: hypothetical protein VK670_02185 [Silvibacterium sp.]|nr:hypothetical protein [Silvibacterium sp.]
MKKTYNVKTLLCAGVLLALAVTWCNLAQAQSCTATWTGNANDGVWTNPKNWDPQKVPGAKSDVCIPAYASAGAVTPVSVHSLQIGTYGEILIQSKNSSTSFSVATSLTNEGYIQLYGVALSAASIDNSTGGQIACWNTNSSITSPAFSNDSADSSGGFLYVGAGVTVKLADNPVQLQNGNLSGGVWEVDDTGLLIIPSDISQLTTVPGAPSGSNVVTITGRGLIQDTSGKNAFTPLTSVGAGVILDLNQSAPLVLNQSLTSAGSISTGPGPLTINGTLTLQTGASMGLSGGSLSATSVLVESGAALGGSGTVASSITNQGLVDPMGTLTVTGSYSQAASAALTEYFYSTLNVNANASLSGALNVLFSPKHPPASGAKYTALTAGSLSGSFTSHTAVFTLTQGANNIVVTKQ